MAHAVEERVTTARVSLRGVSKRYGDGNRAVHAVNDVDLDLVAGEFVVVLGPSGSGKTTLLNLVGGIDSPSSGELVVSGEPIHGLGTDDLTDFRRSAVGFVFQFFNLVPTMTAQENVELVAELTGPDASARAARALADVELGDRADHFPGQLSGGEQQRVAIARAVVKEPPVLLCDEPTGALDLVTGRHVLTLLRQMNVATSCTVMIVTHNSAIAEMADRVLRMRSGRVVADQTLRDPIPPEMMEW